MLTDSNFNIKMRPNFQSGPKIKFMKSRYERQKLIKIITMNIFTKISYQLNKYVQKLYKWNEDFLTSYPWKLQLPSTTNYKLNSIINPQVTKRGV